MLPDPTLFAKRLRAILAMSPVEKGEGPGHPFRGNQHTGGKGSGGGGRKYGPFGQGSEHTPEEQRQRASDAKIAAAKNRRMTQAAAAAELNRAAVRAGGDLGIPTKKGRATTPGPKPMSDKARAARKRYRKMGIIKGDDC